MDRDAAQPIVTSSIDIAASAAAVWRALTEPEKIATWMGGARVESAWHVGSEIAFTGKLPGRAEPYRDRGTVLELERERLLRYSHWAELSRLPDTRENRTTITFDLDAIDGQRTRVGVRHEGFPSDAAYRHARFFWGHALADLKDLVERSSCASVRSADVVAETTTRG
jgi:uncharacterized protein YndB with AHSA1/START domain